MVRVPGPDYTSLVGTESGVAGNSGALSSDYTYYHRRADHLGHHAQIVGQHLILLKTLTVSNGFRPPLNPRCHRW